MFIFFVCSLFIFHVHTAFAVTQPYIATEHILLDCGASSPSSDSKNRTWDSDNRSKYAPLDAANISFESLASGQHPSVVQVPYMTARVFRSHFTYSFPLSSGQKFLRLYFYPSDFSEYNSSLSFFSVTANEFTILSNFSASLNSNPSDPSFTREFIVNVGDYQWLNLTFSPNPNSFAFVNGIEIISIPEKLYFQGNKVPIKGINQLFYLGNDKALQNLYRLNMGGASVDVTDDTGMYRAWIQDDSFIFGTDSGFTPSDKDARIEYTNQTPPYSAPEIVYQTSRTLSRYGSSLQWHFDVDSGFNYLLRLHFCEFQRKIINKSNQRVFSISIDDAIAEIQADVIEWTRGNDIPIFRDYVARVPNDGRHGLKSLRLSLAPDKESHPIYETALLNGLEIFKISDSNRNLAGGNANLSSATTPETEPKKKKNDTESSFMYAVIGSVIAIVGVISAVIFLLLRRRRRTKLYSNVPKSSWISLPTTNSISTTKTCVSVLSLPSDLCRHFLLEEIKSATNNFDEKCVIGKGGFGDVYKGLMDSGATTVAIKRLNPSSSQGVREFQTEIEMLSKLRHLHLVSLTGYCDENGEMILVYDYMAQGTLRDHLYNSDNPPLKWTDRLKICIGAAKGLHYLHTGTKHAIIHRDVKSTNILLDEKWVAKVSDFGLSKVGSVDGHVSTVVRGSFGYVDPEYYRRQQLTDKSDVYSFGVVLFEVLCGRPAILPKLSTREQVNLGEWAKCCYEKGCIDKMIDPNLQGKISPACLSKFVETAIVCLREKGIERPMMSDVVWGLEFALQLQEASGGTLTTGAYSMLNEETIITDNDDDDEIFSCGDVRSSGFDTSDSKMKSDEVFSEIANPSLR